MRHLIKNLWRQYRREAWLNSDNGFGYFRALDDVFDALDRDNPCHDEVRLWIANRKRELVNREPIK